MLLRSLIAFILSSSFVQATWAVNCAQVVVPDTAKAASINLKSSPFSIIKDEIWFLSQGKRVSLEGVIDLYAKSSNKAIEDESPKDIPVGIEHRKTVELISLVGRIGSVRKIDVWSAGARPFGSAQLLAINIDNPKKPVLLQKLFRDKDILNSFAESKDEVLSAAGRRVIEEGGTAKDIVGFGLSEQFLREFAFTGVSGECVIVSFLINSGGHGDGLDNDTFYSIGLPLPAKLRSSLLKANSLAEGFVTSNRSGLKAVRVDRHTVQ